MAEWWEGDPVAQGTASGAVSQWWDTDPIEEPTQRQASMQEVREGKSPDYRQTTGFLPSGVQRVLDRVADPFGVQDEMIGAGQFVRKLVTSGGDFGEAGQAYSDATERVRAEQDVAREDYGIAPELIGGFGTTGLAKGFKMAPTLAGRVKQSAGAGALFGSATGVAQSEGGIKERVIGGLEGGVTGAALGPIVTEIGGPVIGGIVRGAKSGARGLGNAARFVRSRGANTDARLNRAMQQQKMTPQQGISRLDEVEGATRFGKKQLDSEHVLADLGPSTRDLADTTALVSQEARGQSTKFLSDRSQGQYGRINNYLRRALQVTRDNFARNKGNLISEQQTLSKTAYDEFRNADVRIPVGDILYNRQIDDLAAAPALKRTLKRARDQFVAATGKREISAAARKDHAQLVRQIAGDLNSSRDSLRQLRRARQDASSKSEKDTLLQQIRNSEDAVTELSRDLQGVRAGKPSTLYATQAYTELSPARLDAGKRALDDMIESSMRAGRNNESRLLVTLKKQILDVADKATSRPVLDKLGQPTFDAKGNPITESLYAKARDVYGSRAELLEALEDGRKFMRGDSEMTGQQYKALSTGEKRMFRVGIARQVQRDLGAKRVGTDMIGNFDKPNVRAVLEEVMTPAQARKFYELIDLEQAMAATNNAVRGNSKTALRQQNVLDFSFGVRLGRAIKDRGVREALSNEIYEQITKFFSMREADAAALSRVLFETDKTVQRATLNRLAQTYGNKSARAVIDRAERLARKAVANRRRALAGLAGEFGEQIAGPRSQPPQQSSGQLAR